MKKRDLKVGDVVAYEPFSMVSNVWIGEIIKIGWFRVHIECVSDNIRNYKGLKEFFGPNYYLSRDKIPPRRIHKVIDKKEYT